jgi:hypothetical protein
MRLKNSSKSLLVKMLFEETHPGSLHFTTRDTNTEVVKAAYVQKVAKNLNRQWARQMKDGALCHNCECLESVTVCLLISNPLASFPIEFLQPQRQ